MKGKTRDILEAVFWHQASSTTDTLGHMMKFDPNRGNLPVVDTKTGPIVLEFGSRVAISIDGELIGATVVESDQGQPGGTATLKLKTTDGRVIRIERGPDVLSKYKLA